ncbi:MAG: hypothetical protein KGZ83_13360 [Sulfuricella sp.]|nr:hypothetical protein [Sulfuricella sp.]
MKKIKARLKEPSTWAGLGMLAGLFGLAPMNEAMQTAQAIGLILGGGAAGAAIMLPEGSRGG